MAARVVPAAEPTTAAVRAAEVRRHGVHALRPTSVALEEWGSPHTMIAPLREVDDLAADDGALLRSASEVAGRLCGEVHRAVPMPRELRRALLGPSARPGWAARRRAGGEPVPAGRRWPGMELTCPKCHGTMRTYERNGVHVDQCADCRGIFLDRGELERLVDAENAWHGSGPSGPAPQPAAPTAGQHGRPAPAAQPSPPLPAGALGAVVGEVLKQARAGQHGSSHGYGTHGKKKQSFLSDLFG